MSAKAFDKNAHFCFCVLFSTYLEIEAAFSKNEIKSYVNFIETQQTLFDSTKYILIARHTEPGKYDQEVEEELNKCNFNQEQRDFIWKWIRREIDLLKISE